MACKGWLIGLVAAVLVGGWTVRARAFMRASYEDAEVVGRSELIVVGRVKEGSIDVQHATLTPAGGEVLGTRAVLLVDEVLKGVMKEKEVAIMIRRGLEVRVGRKGAWGAEVAEGGVSLVDTGSSAWTGSPLVEDLREPSVWMLRHAGAKPQWGDTGFGIKDPEDVQPVKLRKYLECYLAADPEAGVRAALRAMPEIGARAVRYLGHREVGRILKEADAEARVLRLLPYYEGKASWGLREEAREGIVAAGAVAGPYLRGLYEASTEDREGIIRMWAEMRYTGCVEMLVDVLKEEDQFWARQTVLPEGRKEGESREARERRESFRRVAVVVAGLGKIGDVRARAGLELTRRRWVGDGELQRQMTEACDLALQWVGETLPVEGRK